MMSRAFVLESNQYSCVYLPKMPTVRKGERHGPCVYMCTQFMEYPVDQWGRRVIPADAVCPYVKECDGLPVRCNGQYVWYNGNMIESLYRYAPVSCVINSESDRQRLIADVAKRNQNGR